MLLYFSYKEKATKTFRELVLDVNTITFSAASLKEERRKTMKKLTKPDEFSEEGNVKNEFFWFLNGILLCECLLLCKKKYAFFDKIKSLHLMCCHWKLVEKLILKKYSKYNSFDKFPQQLVVLQIGSWTGSNWDVYWLLSCTWYYKQLHFCL